MLGYYTVFFAVQFFFKRHCVIFDYSPLGNVWHTLCLFLNILWPSYATLSLHRSLLIREWVREELTFF
jgi:hypothetical protein